MRLARAIATLNDEREGLLNRAQLLGESHKSYHWLMQRAKAIETVAPVLQAELERRHVAVMERRIMRDIAQLGDVARDEGE